MITRIKNARIILPHEVLTGCDLYYEDGLITAITQESLPFDEEIDAQGEMEVEKFKENLSDSDREYFAEAAAVRKTIDFLKANAA